MDKKYLSDFALVLGGEIQFITKEIAIQHQLEMALGLFFQGGESIAIHTLAAAAYWSLEDIYHDKTGKEGTLMQELRKSFPDEEDFKLARICAREPQNFFKHADGQTCDEDLPYDTSFPKLFMRHAIWMFDAVFEYINHSMSAFGVWYVLKNPDECETDELGEMLREKYSALFDEGAMDAGFVKIAGLFRGRSNEQQYRLSHCYYLEKLV